MKKVIKAVSVISLICLVCISFSGCNKINEMKSRQGFYDENGDIILGDEKYVKFSTVLTENMYFESDYEPYYITKEDVPVLIAASEGTPYHKSKDGIFLSAVHDVEIYCRSDKAKEMEAKLTAPHNYTKLMYSYEMYSDNPFSDNWDTKNKVFTDEETAAVAKVMNETAPVDNMELLIENNFLYSVEVYSATDDLLFRKSEFYIYILDEAYFIKTEEQSDKSALIYSVPKDLNTVFEAITREYVNS